VTHDRYIALVWSEVDDGERKGAGTNDTGLKHERKSDQRPRKTREPTGGGQNWRAINMETSSGDEGGAVGGPRQR